MSSTRTAQPVTIDLWSVPGIRQYAYGYGVDITNAIKFLDGIAMQVPRTMPENVTKEQYENYKELLSNLTSNLVLLSQGDSLGTMANDTVRKDFCLKINRVKEVLSHHEANMQSKYGIDSGLPKPKAYESDSKEHFRLFRAKTNPPPMSDQEYVEYQRQLNQQSADLKRLYGIE